MFGKVIQLSKDWFKHFTICYIVFIKWKLTKSKRKQLFGEKVGIKYDKRLVSKEATLM